MKQCSEWLSKEIRQIDRKRKLWQNKRFSWNICEMFDDRCKHFAKAYARGNDHQISPNIESFPDVYTIVSTWPAHKRRSIDSEKDKTNKRYSTIGQSIACFLWSVPVSKCMLWLWTIDSKIILGLIFVMSSFIFLTILCNWTEADRIMCELPLLRRLSVNHTIVIEERHYTILCCHIR